MKIKKLFFFIYCLLPSLLFSQNEPLIKVLNKSVLDSPINKIYETFKQGDKTILLGDTRSKGDLNILIIVFDSLGNKIKDQVVGEKNVFERPVTLVEKGGGNKYLLSNVFEENKKKLILFHLDDQYQIIDKDEIPIQNNSEGKSMIINRELAIINISVLDDNGDIYPSLITYNLNTKTIDKEFSLKKENNLMPPKKQRSTLFKTNEDGKLLKSGMVETLKSQNSYRTCNQILFSNSNKEEMVLLGYESTDEISDFWSCKINGEEIVWDKIYASKIGGDEGVDLLALKNETYLLSGVGYTKKFDENYHLRTLLINSRGDIIKEHKVKNKSRTFYKKATVLSSNKIIVLGQSEVVKYNEVLFGEKIEETEISLYFYNENLTLKSEAHFPVATASKVIGLVPFNKQLMGVFYLENEKNSFMKLAIEN